MKTQTPIRDESLRGKPITLTEAAHKYGVPRSNVFVWLQHGYITTLKPGYRMTLDESDVAYCVEIYRQHQRTGSRAPLFDEDGQPYTLRNPEMAAYKRQRRKKARAALES